MNIPMKNRMSYSFWVRFAGIAVAATALPVILSTGCSNTADGDRCDVVLSHDECSGGPTVACVMPNPVCGNAYCCSLDPTTGAINDTNVNCQPVPCPGEEAAAPVEEASAPAPTGDAGSAGTD